MLVEERKLRGSFCREAIFNPKISAFVSVLSGGFIMGAKRFHRYSDKCGGYFRCSK